MNFQLCFMFLLVFRWGWPVLIAAVSSFQSEEIGFGVALIGFTRSHTGASP